MPSEDEANEQEAEESDSSVELDSVDYGTRHAGVHQRSALEDCTTTSIQRRTGIPASG